MELSLVLLNKLASMMIMAVVGYILVRMHILRQEDSKPISILLIRVLQPCLVMRAFQIDLTAERMRGFIFAIIFSSLSMLLCIIVSKLMEKPFRLDTIDQTTLIYANVGNLILPLISMSLGEDMVFYGSAFQVPFNALIWTHGYFSISGERDVNLKKILMNPSIIALFIGLFLMITQLRLPSIIDTAAKGFNDMVAPASMMLVGMVIAGSDLKTVFAYRKSYLISFVRLIALPVITMLLLYVTGYIQRNPEMRPVAMIVALGTAAPSASMIVQLAVMHDKDALKASIYNVMTTILCVVTIPLVMLLFQTIFPA